MKIGYVFTAAALIGLPQAVLAQSNISIGDFATTRVQGTDYLGTISHLINFFLSLAGIVAFVYAIYGGYLYITSRGDPAAVTKARNTLVGAIIGVIVIGVAYTLVSLFVRVPNCQGQNLTVDQCLQQTNTSTNTSTGSAP